MRISLVMLAAGAFISIGETASVQPPVEIRFCPAAQARPYPLDSRGREQGLRLQNFAVVNLGSKAYEVIAIRIALLKGDRVMEERLLDSSEIRRWSDDQSPLQEATREVPFQICGTNMIGADITPGGPVLGHNQAMLVVQQDFAYDHERDALQVTIDGSVAGQAAQVTASLPIRAGFAKTQFAFPLRGTWYVGWGPSFHTGHRGTPAEEFAFDIGKLGPNSKTYQGDGKRFTDYFAYGADVRAAADGHVIAAVDGRPENPDALQRPGESSKSYVARYAPLTAALLAKGPDFLAGNYVMLDHGNSEYSLYAHLQPGRVKVKVGQEVRAGDFLGQLGSSGNSTEPHLHFHVCDRPDPLMCAGIPISFTNIAVLWSDDDRALQSGDIVTTH